MDEIINFEEQYNNLIEEQTIKELQKIKEELQEYKDDLKNTMDEECLENDDRKHCSCVPSLRKVIKDLTKERNNFKNALAPYITNTSNYGINPDLYYNVCTSRNKLSEEVYVLKNQIEEIIKERDDYKLKGEILCSQLGTIMVEFDRFKKVFNEV
jgi:hypothetical protein